VWTKHLLHCRLKCYSCNVMRHSVWNCKPNWQQPFISFRTCYDTRWKISKPDGSKRINDLQLQKLKTRSTKNNKGNANCEWVVCVSKENHSCWGRTPMSALLLDTANALGLQRMAEAGQSRRRGRMPVCINCITKLLGFNSWTWTEFSQQGCQIPL
jgi:hypothetical protein